MTGKVKSFCQRTGRGLIETEDGGTALFEISDVLTYDRLGLKPGNVVSFVAGEAAPMHAFEIFVRTGHTEGPSASRPKDAEDLRYTGFQTVKGSRIYSFEARVAGEETRQYRVEAEVALLLEHHVSLQETPSLCLRLLHAKLLAHSVPSSPKLVHCHLGQADILSMQEHRGSSKPRYFPRPKRGIRGPAPLFGAEAPIQGPLPPTAGGAGIVSADLARRFGAAAH